MACRSPWCSGGLPISFLEKTKYNIGLYVQDRWTVKRATLNVGVRSDFFNAFAEPQSLSAGPFVPAREFPGVYDVPNWKDLSPRLGVSYDLFGNGRTALKANLGRFPTQSGVNAFTRLADPMNSTVNSVSRTWTDFNGNFVPDCDLASPLANAECGPMQNLNFGKSVPTTRYAKDVSEGFGVRTYNWEGSVGVQHELMSGLSVNGVVQPPLVRQLPGHAERAGVERRLLARTASRCRSTPGSRAAAATSCAGSTTSASPSRA